MAARSFRLVLSLFVSLSAALPSAAEVVVRLPTSQKTEVSPGPARSPDPLNARSYFGARYYRADLGRFTTVDPVYTWQENLVDPQRWNRYAYVRNNPLRYTDPDGRCIYPGADCAQYLFGAVKGFVNGFSGMATMVNQATNTLLGPFTDFRFGAAPRWEPTNIDQARGEVAFGVASLFALGQAAAVKAGELGTAVGSAQEGGLALR
jgi:RHS repeat-associated protein